MHESLNLISMSLTLSSPWLHPEVTHSELPRKSFPLSHALLPSIGKIKENKLKKYIYIGHSSLVFGFSVATQSAALGTTYLLLAAAFPPQLKPQAQTCSLTTCSFPGQELVR